MKDRKYKRMLRWDPPYDVTGIEKKMERMAQAGWMLDGASKLCWKFKRTEPKRVHFKAVYYSDQWPGGKEVLANDPSYASDHQRTYWDYCAEDGWVLAVNDRPLQIFYNERENITPIETDAGTKVEVIHQAMRSNRNLRGGLISPLVWAFLLTLFFVTTDYSLVYSVLIALIWLLLEGLMIVFVVIRMLRNRIWYQRAKKCAQETGKFLQPKGYYYRWWSFLAIEVVAFAGVVILYFAMVTTSDKKSAMPVTIQELTATDNMDFSYNMTEIRSLRIKDIEFSQSVNIDLADISFSESAEEDEDALPDMYVRVYIVRNAADHQRAWEAVLDDEEKKENSLEKISGKNWKAVQAYQSKYNGDEGENFYYVFYKDRAAEIVLEDIRATPAVQRRLGKAILNLD